MYELFFSSQQPLTKDLRKHVCNVILPIFVSGWQKGCKKNISNNLNRRIQAGTGHPVWECWTAVQGEIHAKDQQGERCENTINHLRKRHVDHKKKLVMVVRKHAFKDNKKHVDYPYYIARI